MGAQRRDLRGSGDVFRSDGSRIRRMEHHFAVIPSFTVLPRGQALEGVPKIEAWLGLTPQEAADHKGDVLTVEIEDHDQFIDVVIRPDGSVQAVSEFRDRRQR